VSKYESGTCARCGQHSECVETATGLGVCCWDVQEGPLGPAVDVMADDTRETKKPVGDGYERLLRLAEIVANPANWTRRHKDGPLNIWMPHPEIYATAGRILADIKGEDQ